MVGTIILFWYLLTLGSLIYILWDQFTNTPSMRVMTLAWALLTIYLGPIALLIYWVSCRQPAPGSHEQFIGARWKQAIGSVIHCVAGDATAIIFMAAVLYYFQPTNGVELVLEYIAAYIFGLFIFQALFMRAMYSSYWMAVRKTIFAETVSMNLVMLGMFTVIMIWKHFFPHSSDPFTPYFWIMMSVATLIGFIVTYPINYWMVKHKIKHGMMSRMVSNPAAMMNVSTDHHSMAHMHDNHMDHAMKADAGHTKMTMDQANHEQVSPAKLWVLIIGTYALFFLGIWIIGLFIPIHFSW